MVEVRTSTSSFLGGGDHSPLADSGVRVRTSVVLVGQTLLAASSGSGGQRGRGWAAWPDRAGVEVRMLPFEALCPTPVLS